MTTMSKRSTNLNRAHKSARLNARNVADLYRAFLSDEQIQAMLDERQMRQDAEDDAAIENSKALAADTALWPEGGLR
jgi:hypothetical protein